MKIIILVLILILALGCAKKEESPAQINSVKIRINSEYVAFTGKPLVLDERGPIYIRVYPIDTEASEECGYIIKDTWESTANTAVKMVIYVPETWDETNYYKTKLHVAE